jgi:methyl coenzyme M reductase subunit C-like uncharacterized protein (methanogenesis marker protein 7)
MSLLKTLQQSLAIAKKYDNDRIIIKQHQVAINALNNYKQKLVKEITKLEADKINIPKFSLFGDNQHDVIDEKLRLIKEDLEKF